MGDFNTTLLPIDRSFRQKLNREMLKLTDIIKQMDPVDIYITFHLNTKGFAFFSAPHLMFSKTDHILEHKTRLNRHKKTEATPCSLFHHMGEARYLQQQK